MEKEKRREEGSLRVRVRVRFRVRFRDGCGKAVAGLRRGWDYGGV